MKLQLNLLWLVPIIGFNIGCSCDKLHRTPADVIASLNETDSLRLIDSLFSELKSEIYNSPRYDISKDEMIDDGVIICGIRNIFRVKVNAKNQIMAGMKLNGDIRSLVIEYFGKNRDVNDPSNNFPMYSRIKCSEINEYLNQSIHEAKRIESIENALPEIIEYKWKEVDEWKEKQTAIKILNIEELPEPDYGAHITLDYPDTYKKKDSLLASIFSGFYTLRNQAALRYFKNLISKYIIPV